MRAVYEGQDQTTNAKETNYPYRDVENLSTPEGNGLNLDESPNMRSTNFVKIKTPFPLRRLVNGCVLQLS